MKRSRFSEEQIIGILKDHETGVSVADLCRKHGVSDARIYKWKAKFGGMDVSEAKRLRALEDENAKLKRMLADAWTCLRKVESSVERKRRASWASRKEDSHRSLRGRPSVLSRRAAVQNPDDREHGFQAIVSAQSTAS